MPPVNDNFADAIVLDPAGGELTFSTIGATTQVGEPPAGEGHTVWFKITPTVSHFYTVRTGRTALPVWDSLVSIYTGSTLVGLTLVTNGDDNDLQPGTGPFGTGAASWNAVAGTTYWIQVAAYDDVTGPVERADAVLTWGQATLPPTVSSISPATGTVGTEVFIFGTGFTDATRVTIGNTIPVPFTIIDDTHISLVLPLLTELPVGNWIVVSNASGGQSGGFTYRWPGEWVQPDDRWMGPVMFSADGRTRYQYSLRDGGGLETPIHHPSEIGAVEGQPLAEISNYSLEIQGQPDGLGGVDGVLYRREFTAVGVDVAQITDPATTWVNYLVAVPPTSGEVTAAGAAAYELEGGAEAPGVAVGPLRVHRQYGFSRISEFDTGTTRATTDMNGITGQIRRLAAGTFHFILDGSSPPTPRGFHLELDTLVWPGLSDRPLVDEVPMPTGPVDTFTGGWQIIPAALIEDDVDLTLADLDDDGKIGFALVLSSDTGDHALVSFTDPPPSYDYQKRVDFNSLPWTLDIYYRPPRFRYLYDRPQPKIDGTLRSNNVGFRAV